MILLVNFNSYLGGGETLLLRFADYLSNNKYQHRVLCTKSSYIKRTITQNSYREILEAPDLLEKGVPYINGSFELNQALSALRDLISKEEELIIYTFCIRELYFISMLKTDVKVIHLALHYHDHLYLSQTLLDKSLAFFFGIQQFRNRRFKELNKTILRKLAVNRGLILQGELLREFWSKEFNFEISCDLVVPLGIKEKRPHSNMKVFERKILWIGRLVDFKIPALLSLLEFLASDRSYSLTIVGSGNLQVIKNKITQLKLESNVVFLGELHHTELPGIIQSHDVGYAMGTSIVEMAMHGLPCILALGSPNFLRFDFGLCGGHFHEGKKGDIGEALYFGEPKNHSIQFILSEIEENYSRYSKLSRKKAIDDFSQERNFAMYLRIGAEVKPICLELDDFEVTKLRGRVFSIASRHR